MISDKRLADAAAAVSAAMTQALPEPADCARDFSPAFDKNMAPLFARDRRTARRGRVLRQLAAACIALVIGAGVWLCADPQARASVASWVLEIYDFGVSYRFLGEQPTEELPLYILTWMPEGFEEVEDSIVDDVRLIWYTNESGDDLIFEYYFMVDGILTQISTDEEMEVVSVGQYTGYFYPEDEDSPGNGLLWFDENTNIAFFLYSTLSQSVMLHIAENIILFNPTK